jgi:hypothetical protein
LTKEQVRQIVPPLHDIVARQIEPKLTPMPMMTVKIDCDCGQRYAFDVEPVGGVLPTAVACPACGADGMAKANEFIASHTTAQEPATSAPAAIRISAPAQASVRIAAPAPAPPPSSAAPGLRVSSPAAAPSEAHSTIPYRHVDPERARNEARAKILWGEEPKAVASFLRAEGLSFEDATAMVQALQVERAATIRNEGVKKILIGAGLICIPIFAFAASAAAGRFAVRPLAVTVALGFYGIWTFVTGLFKFLAPKSEAGDAFE